MQRFGHPSAQLGLTVNYKRQIRSGEEYDHLFPKPDFTDTLLQEGNVNDTVHLMGEYITKYQGDTKKIAPLLKGKSLAETLRNDWHFVYHHIQYQLDTPGIEELRRPARSWAERKTGVDCDCYTIFLCTLLLNQGIEPVIRVVQIPPATGFHHVYPIIYRNGKSGKYYTLDAVLDRFNEEKPFSKKQDYTMNELGIPIRGLHGIIDNKDDLSDIFPDQEIGSPDDQIYARLVATRDIIESNPAAVAFFEDPERFTIELDYAIKYWNTPQRDQALKILAKREKQLDEIRPLSGIDEDPEDDTTELSQEQVEELVDLLSGDSDSFEGVVSGDDLGRILLRKSHRFRDKEARLKKRLNNSHGQHHRNTSCRLKHVTRLRKIVDQVNNLDTESKNKAAQILKQTYNDSSDAANSENTPDNNESLPEQPGGKPLDQFQQEGDIVDPINQDFIEIEPSRNYNDDLEPERSFRRRQNFNPVVRDTYLDDPYDDWLELMENYLDDVEDLEDDIALEDIRELNGLGMVQLGAFWNKRKKRLELKRKRQEKRLKKAQKKGKTKQVERLKVKLEKNKIKLEDPKKWKNVRTQWRKENKRGFWQGIQKAGKSAIKAIVKFNPVSIAARNGFLMALKLNVKKMSSRLKWGYATKEQAIKHGMSVQRWQKSKEALKQVENLFVNKTKGSKSALKKAILKGGKGLNGFELSGLNGPELAAVAAAATPLIVAVVNILKKAGIIDPKIQLKKVENDIKKGKLEDNSDVPPSQFDDVQLDIEIPWYQQTGVKIAGAVGGGLLLLGTGYAVLKKSGKHKKQLSSKDQKQLSGPTQSNRQKQKRKVENKVKSEEESIKEIILT